MTDIVKESNEKNSNNITREKTWTRNCPKCHQKLSYCSNSKWNRAKKKKTWCKLCSQQATKEKRRKYHHNILQKACPTCKKIIEFSNKYKYERSIQNNRLCFSCSKKGKNNPMFGIVGEKNPSYRIERSPEVKKKMRLGQIKRLQEQGILERPMYNPNACNYIDNINKQMGWKLQHAENGGEYYLRDLGYWVDGYDKQRNIVLEYDERQHYVGGNLKPKDILRMNEIKNHLSCKFYRYREQTKELKCY